MSGSVTTLSPSRAVASTTGTNISVERSISRSGSEPGCRYTVPMIRNGGSSSATSYATLWTLRALRSDSVSGGRLSSPEVTRIRSYGYTLLSPGAGSSVSPSGGPHSTSEIVIASRLFSASESLPLISIRPASRQSSVRAPNGTPRTGAFAPRPGATAPLLSTAAPPFFFRKPNGTRSLLRLAAVLADRVDDRRVGERRHVAQLASLRNVAEEPAHDLARPRLGQVGDEHQELGPRDGPDDVRDVLAQLDAEMVVRLLARLEDHEREDRLARDRVVLADDGGLGDGLVVDQRRLDLGGRDPMAGHVHHVVDAPEQPQVAVEVTFRAVAGEVHALEPAPVGLLVALRIAVDPAQHPGPRPL